MIRQALPSKLRLVISQTSKMGELKGCINNAIALELAISSKKITTQEDKLNARPRQSPRVKLDLWIMEYRRLYDGNMEDTT